VRVARPPGSLPVNPESPSAARIYELNPSYPATQSQRPAAASARAVVESDRSCWSYLRLFSVALLTHCDKIASFWWRVFAACAGARTVSVASTGAKGRRTDMYQEVI